MTITVHTTDELEALQAEGFLPIDGNIDLIMKVGAYQQARTQRDAGTKVLEKIKPVFNAVCVQNGTPALTIDGTVVVRRKTPQNTNFKLDQFKADHPELYEKYVDHKPGVQIWVAK